MTLACGLTTCVAFAATTDIVALFLGIIVTAIAKMLLNAADIIVTPLLAITSMTTQEIEAYIPGLNNSDPNGVGNFFSSAISIIAYTIAGVLLCCHIISYLIALANDERLESIPKLIWNGMFGIVLTIAGKNLLSLLFNEIIAPLSEALVDGMQSAGGMSFTFEGKANDIISLGDGISAFDLTALGTLFVVLVMLLLIWWNLVKLILECAQRYIICVVTINLSPLAFATATTEQTKETAMNWLKMFWSQCVLLVLNIWVVGIARTALNNGMIGGSSTELVTWALITYAFLKIAQQLDDMMEAAGLKVTRMNGIDPFSEAQGVMRNLTGIGAAVNTALGYGKGALDTLRSDKASGDGKNPTLTEADLNRAEADFDKTDAQRKTGLDKGSINTASYNDDAHKKAMENVLKTEGALKEGEQVEGVKIGEDGALNATAVKRDERGRITSSREIKATNTGDGLGLTPAETPTSSLRVGNGGKSAIVANEKGTFKLESQGKNEEGENVWKATQLTDANGNKISDVAPETDATQTFAVDADWDDDPQHKKDGYAASAVAFFTDNQETNESMMDELAQRTADAADIKKQQDEAEQKDIADKIGMTDEDRVANMMGSDSSVDYNSDNAKKAMEDYIMENKDQNPGLAPFAEALEKGGHITSMSMADGSTPAVPQGALQFEITRPKAPGDKNPDITAGAISNPATATPTPAETPEASPVQNEQPEGMPATKQDVQGEEGAGTGQSTVQSADAPAADKKTDEEPAPVDVETPLESTSVPETPNGAPTGETLDNSAVAGDESPIEAAAKPDAEQEVPGTVGVEQSIEMPAPIDATQPLDSGITPKAEENPEANPLDAAGVTPVVDATGTASNEPQDANIPTTEQVAGNVQPKPDTQGEVPQVPTAGVHAETAAEQNEITPEAIQGQTTAPIANEANQPAASVSTKQPDSTTAGSPDAIQTQNPATTTATPATPATMDSAPTSGAPANGVTASNAQESAGTISSPAGDGTVQQAQGAAPVAATTVQPAPTGTTQSAPVISQPQTEAGTVSGPAVTTAPSTATQGSVQNIPDSSTNVSETPAPTVSAVGSGTPSANASAHGVNATTQTVERQSTQASVPDASTAATPEMQSAENGGVGLTAPTMNEAPVNSGSTSDTDVANAVPGAQTAPEAHEPNTAGTANAMPASDGTPYMSGEGAAPTAVDTAPETTGQTAQVVVDATAPTDSNAAVTIETAPTNSDTGNVTESSDVANDTPMVSDEPDTTYTDGESPVQNLDDATVQSVTEKSEASIATETHEPDGSALTSETFGNSSDTTDTVADTVGDTTSVGSDYEPTDTGVANSVGSEGVSDDGMAATSPANDSNVAASSSDSDNDADDEPDSAYTHHSSSDYDDGDSETVHDSDSGANKHSDSASNGDDADDVDTGTYEAEDSPIADGAGFYGEGTGNSFKEDEIKAATDDSMSSAAEPEAQSIHADVPDTTSGTVVETTTVPDAKQTGDATLGQAQADTTMQQSNEQAEEASIPSVPQGIVLSNTSVNKLSDTNGTIRSASAGVFQLTREGLDEDTGKTVWRATLKQDAEGNPVTDYSANTFTFERTAKWNAQTRSYQPEGFDSVAKEVREAVDFRDISQSANQSRGSRRSDKPQNPPEHERFKRERNPRAYTDDARLTEGRRTTSTSRGGKHRAQRKSDTAKRRDNPLKNMDGFKTKR